MNRFLPLLVLVLALPASAGDAAHGKQVFNKACGQCHLAGPARKDSRAAAETDNLAQWLSTHSSAELNQWVANPWKVKSQTRCDPRQLRKPQDLNDLISYLRGAQGSASKP